jgi:single-strand DNA-binding protein
MGINHIALMGTIIRGPEFRMTPNGVPTANFSLAVTRPPRQDGGAEVTDYVRIVVWRNLAEKVNESVQKGDLVVVEGRLTTRSYETSDGQRRKTIEVEASAVDAVKVPTGRSAASAAEPWEEHGDVDDVEVSAPQAQSAPAPRRAAPAPAKSAPPPADLDDEIPF